MIKNPDPRVKWAMDIMDQEGEVWSVNKYLWKLCVCNECLGWRNSTFALFRSSLGWLVEPTSPFPSEHSLLSWTRQEMPWTGFLWGVDWDLKQTWKNSLYLLLAGQIWPVQSCSAPSPLLLAIGIRAGWREGNSKHAKWFCSHKHTKCVWYNHHWTGLLRRMPWWNTTFWPTLNTFLNQRRCWEFQYN